ncbi:MAG: galactokinase [Verrucomicrobiales bacterium]|nr:galactokinase [Verrucomicrobiales bacterium]
MNRAHAVDGFRQAFGTEPSLLAQAPGRVNLIGEHTDYNDGFVMPVAIEFATWTAIAPRPDRLLRVFAGNKSEKLEINLDAPGAPLQKHWGDYVRGIAVELEKDGQHLRGADLWFAGNVPDGAGLSSSAALEMSVGTAVLANSGLPIDRVRLALAGQRAEHNYAGTKCGIMDQFISANGEAGHALMLDCRSLQFQLLPIPDSLRLVICDTGVKHQLAGGEYNVRRAQCEQGVESLRAVLPGIRALRDVTSGDFERHSHRLPDVVQRRCRHVISENERVQHFADALNRHDLPALGRLMAASHASLRDDYQVSCRELDTLVDCAQRAPGLVGARMTGGGFGGCTVNLVEATQAAEFQTSVAASYQTATGRAARLFVSSAAAGAGLAP